MAVQVLGKVAYFNRGAYNSETTYEINDVVSYNGSSYVSLDDNNRGNLPTNTTYWSVVALKGDKGDVSKEQLDKVNANLQSQINGLASGSPLVASSTSGMTDTTKVYVNTSDGYWYYYDGSDWVAGGTYQATSIADDSINKYMLDDNLKKAVYKSFGTTLDISQADIVHLFKNNNANSFKGASNVNSLVIPIGGNTFYAVRKVLSTRFSLFLSEDYPASGVTITNYVGGSSSEMLSITSGADDKYLTIFYYNQSSDTLTELEIRNSIKVYEDYIEDEITQADYLNEKTNEINKNTLRNDLKNAIYKVVGTNLDISNAKTVNLVKNTNSNAFVGGVTAKSLVVPIEGNTDYIVKKVLSTRFSIYLSEYYPYSGCPITNYITNNNATELQITSAAGDKYLTIFYYNQSSDTLSDDEIKNSIKVYKDTVVDDETQVQYLENRINIEYILSDKYLKLVSTKYLGPLQKGYIALSADDGTNNLADVTVDIFKGYKTTYNKNIPLTLGLMSNSAIFSDNTRKAKVLELIMVHLLQFMVQLLIHLIQMMNCLIF